MKRSSFDEIGKTIDQTGKTIDNILSILNGKTVEGFLLWEQGYAEKVYINGIYEIWISEFKAESSVNTHEHLYSTEILTCISGKVKIEMEDGGLQELLPQQTFVIGSKKKHTLYFYEDTKLVTIAIPPIQNLGVYSDVKN